uniref:Alpha-1,3-glucosyltransferase n=1 Tax=Schistosoma japonicum TaxID=6182 RepID=C1L3X0_SCHJA|nr:asparagine-linked glycosylation 8 homolog (alpha-1,3-glucosyltransferase) [Schistosoma japonicum]
MSAGILFSVIAAAVAFKALFLFSYHSTDFEVHRNWIAITYSLPISKWYFDETSIWTLDYPPFFALFEWLLSFIAVKIDSNICTITAHPYISNGLIIFQRLSVIVSEFLMFAALVKIRHSLKLSGSGFLKRSYYPLLILFAFNFGLLIVDHIHFQYNGFLFGLLILSMAHIIEENYIFASLLFTALLNFKHIFMYIAPAYFVHILMNYCVGKRELSDIISRFVKVGGVVTLVMISSFGYFIYTKQLKQVFSRLFPFNRGLCHAYWAPNFWSLYNFIDKVLNVLDDHFLQMWPQKISTTATMTGGLVENVEHVILPTITPSHTALLSLLFMLPTLCVSIRKSRFFNFTSAVISHVFLKSVIVTAWSCFIFGWHVHEKAVLMFLLPLNLFTLISGEYRFLTFYVSTLGYYSLIPLIPTNAEFPAVVSIYLAHTCIHWLTLFRILPVNNNISERSKLDQSTISHAFQRIGRLHLWGLILLFIFTNIVLPLSYLGQRLPYLPLMLSSVYTAVGIFCSFVIFIWSTTTSYYLPPTVIESIKKVNDVKKKRQ